MYYFICSLLTASIPCMLSLVDYKLCHFIRFFTLTMFLLVYYIYGWKSAGIDVGLFICWTVWWSTILDYVVKKVSLEVDTND